MIRQKIAIRDVFNHRVLAELDNEERATRLRLLGKIKAAPVSMPADPGAQAHP